MTPEENVKLTAGQDPIKILEYLGLTLEECKRNVLKLSGGQQQRVALALARALSSFKNSRAGTSRICTLSSCGQ
jgi:putative ABC transport system ATP-binding protein